MFMYDFIKQLEKEMDKKLKKIMSEDMNIMKRCLDSSQIYEEAFVRLKKYISEYHFRSVDEEIVFFRDTKPKLFYKLIYYRKIYNIEMNRPFGIESQRAYLIDEIEAINRYNAKRSDFVRYYRSGLTNLDSLYYLRNRTDTALYLESFYYERDPLFSTTCDYKVARILANELLITYLTEQLEALELHHQNNYFLPFKRLTWQDHKTDLIELIYLLDSKGSLDNVSLTELASYLANVFNTQIDPNLSRTFCDMKIRNTPTPWIDRAKEELLKRMRIWRRKKKNGDSE